MTAPPRELTHSDPAPAPAWAERVRALAWPALTEELDAQGCALAPALLSRAECEQFVALYAREELFRSRVVMQRHGYGQGEYKYFAPPLPDAIGELRQSLYAELVPIANRWNAALGLEVQYPAEH
ncbi:MAG TPA: 2OG-Fe(II) oxygenase, partial [Polyangiaceae bacterium]|nr:2OG-Fe(II) oxygenase [Polyangiaceae bacterium]